MYTPTYIHDPPTLLLFKELQSRLHDRGYQRRDENWYSYSDELIRLLYFRPGRSYPMVWFGLGFDFRDLDRHVREKTVWDSIHPVRCRATHPGYSECAVTLPFRHLVPDPFQFRKLCDFRDQTVSHTHSVSQIIELISTIALPFLERFTTVDQVREFVNSEQGKPCSILPEAIRCLSQK